MFAARLLVVAACVALTLTTTSHPHRRPLLCRRRKHIFRRLHPMVRRPRQLLPVRKAAATSPTGLRTLAAARMIYAWIRLRPVLRAAIDQYHRQTHRARQKSPQRCENQQPQGHCISPVAEKTHFTAARWMSERFAVILTRPNSPTMSPLNGERDGIRGYRKTVSAIRSISTLISIIAAGTAAEANEANKGRTADAQPLCYLRFLLFKILWITLTGYSPKNNLPTIPFKDASGLQLLPRTTNRPSGRRSTSGEPPWIVVTSSRLQ
jgi:hypothetical protein